MAQKHGEDAAKVLGTRVLIDPRFDKVTYDDVKPKLTANDFDEYLPRPDKIRELRF
jgi:hypothetical protein